MERKKKGTMFWERHPSSINYPPDDDYYLRYLANKRPKSSLELFNPAPNNQEKKAVLRVLPSVVALISYSGDVEVMEGSGTIIESNNVTTTVLTSANLIRRASVGAFVENNLIDDLKITVYYCGGESYAGEVVAFDYHYNLAAISFQPKAPLSTAKIAVVDDSLDVSPSLPSFELRPHTDSYKLSPNKGRLSRAFAKVLHIRALTEISPAGVQHTKDFVQNLKIHDQVNHNTAMTGTCKSFDEDEKLRRKEVTEAFLAKLFSSISSIKAAYAEMQFAQSPYDSESIQSADEMIVSELKFLSQLKQCYFKKQVDESSPRTTQLLAEIKEHKSLTKTLQIMAKNLDYEHKLKQSELTFVKEKLEEAKREKKLLEKRLNISGPLSPSDNLHFSILSPSHFISIRWQTVKAIRSFVRLMISEMESAGWDLDAAANSIIPGVVYSSDTHKCFAFESFVCQELFNGFNYPYFCLSHDSVSEKIKQHQQFFDRFIVMKSQKPMEYLAWNPKSTFAKFCRTKYLRLVQPKMEASLFDTMSHRNLLTSGKFPETDFFALFSETAKNVWLLHCLAFSFEPEASIFQVKKKCRFSEVYMECLNQEAFLSSATDPRVAFTVVPGFKIGKTIIQSQVYLT